MFIMISITIGTTLLHGKATWLYSNYLGYYILLFMDQELLSVHARQLQGEEAHRKIGRRPTNGDYDIRGTTCSFAITRRRRTTNFFTDELLVVAASS